MPKMNRAQRRNLMDRCCKRLKSARAYLLITSDGKGMPVYTYDLEGLGKDDTDIRVIAMQGAVGGAMSMLSKADDMLKERVEAKKVEEEKARLAFSFPDHQKAVQEAGLGPVLEAAEKAPDVA